MIKQRVQPLVPNSRILDLLGERRWLKKRSSAMLDGKLCYDLATMIDKSYSEFYRIEVRQRILHAIEKLYPEITSPYWTKMQSYEEPLSMRKRYSIESFNDHPMITIEDIIKVVKEAEV